MRLVKLEDEYKETGFRIVPISIYTIDFIEKNLGDYFLHMKDGKLHAISEAECNKICKVLEEETNEYDLCESAPYVTFEDTPMEYAIPNEEDEL